MKKVTVESGQSMIDICQQEYGSVAALVQLAKDNALRVDADLEAGQVLWIDENKIVKPDVVNYFSSRGIRINTWGVYEYIPDLALADYDEVLLADSDGAILIDVPRIT